MTDLLAERERLYARLSRQKLHSAQRIITQAMLAAMAGRELPHDLFTFKRAESAQ